jgi:hypothetical protein
MKYVPFDPSALKYKKNSKPKAKKSNITERNLFKDDSHGCDGEWANIDDLLPDLSDSNALHSLDLGLLAAVELLALQVRHIQVFLALQPHKLIDPG